VADRLAALEAIATAALAWVDGHTGTQPIHDAVRRHRRVLDPDPGQHLAWPEAHRPAGSGTGADYQDRDEVTA
jgi:hypothetical protein